jgi:hypothetical protein
MNDQDRGRKVVPKLLETHNKRTDEVTQGFGVKLEELSEAITGDISDLSRWSKE